jgi:hypothetical protein
LVILAAHIVGGGEAQIAPMLSVPVFIVMVGLTRLLAGGLASIGLASLRPLLLLQFLLLAGFLVLCVAAGPRIDPNATNAILAGMLGVSAMAVQNALVQISLKGAPSTAVMTSNVTRFAIDVGEVLLGGRSGRCGQGSQPSGAYSAGDCRLHRRLRPRCGMRGRTWHVVFGFACRPRPACVCDGFLRPSTMMDRTDEPNRPLDTRIATKRLACCRRVAGALRSAGPPLLFGLRLWASVCLALYVAFWLELDNAYWAGTSAAITCQPHLGASLRKGWYRMIGTSGGGYGDGGSDGMVPAGPCPVSRRSGALGRRVRSRRHAFAQPTSLARRAARTQMRFSCSQSIARARSASVL